jgi:hypothetical protein
MEYPSDVTSDSAPGVNAMVERGSLMLVTVMED